MSPSSRPEPARVERGAEILRSWGLTVEIGAHAFDQWGHYLAGRDQDRLDDLNDALRDPGVRAIFATCGGKGAYRIADRLDFDAAVSDPKPVVGCSETTILHLALWHRSRVGGFHGPHVAWSDDYYGDAAAASLRQALMEPEPVRLKPEPGSLTAQVVVAGKATGVLMGGNLDMLRTSVGWTCPSFEGAILLIEAVDMHVGAIDRALTQLVRSGRLDGVRGVAIGQFIRSGGQQAGKWSAVEVIYDRLAPLAVPLLGGLPIGHGPSPTTIPLGTSAVLDTEARTLVIQPGVS
ncbi:MAG: LD-carboxypeptidase [Actinomycetota bacterium]|nr:LD-carboxypeptidase [Actinomycetota bacterium]